MKPLLSAAGIYNLVWGAFILAFPLLPFQWGHMAPPNSPEIWQSVGMIVGVYGVGYIIAAFDPVRHWPIILVGFWASCLGLSGWRRPSVSTPAAGGGVCVPHQ